MAHPEPPGSDQMRTKPAAIAISILGAIFATIVFTGQAASAASYTTSSYGSRLLALVNQARSSHGLGTLSWASGTSSVAISWTDHLAQAHALSHNPNLGPQLESHGSANWTIYGENVGEAPSNSPDELFNAYMQSPEHRANILETRYRFIGLGVVFTGSTAWNTMDFVDAYGGATRTTSTATHHVTYSAPRRTTSSQVRPAARPVQHKVVTAKKPAARRPAAPAVKVAALRSAQPSPVPVVAAPQLLPTPVVISAATHGASASALRIAVGLALVLFLSHLLVIARRRRA
jgi:uncharacterized protein YkwD